ncbi:MAG: hypothetical protein D6702_05910 [Planctomycetota bacterium]|nr:MAG: hypothetical protein D6702_05910 [Planctomycetota bacterium]
MRFRLLLLALLPGAAAPLSAQQTFSEPDLSWLDRAASLSQPLGSGGAGGLQWEWGAVLDVIGEWSEVDSLERINEVRPRSVALHGAARLEDFGRAFALVDFSGSGDGSDLILREAGGWLDLLPWNANLRFGKYFADVGAWNRTQLSEFPSPNLDGMRRDFFGGNLAVTGVELHQGFDFGGDGFRWSVGIANDMEGQDPDTVGNGVADRADGRNHFGQDGVDTWLGTARVEFGWNNNDNQMTLGASMVYAPDEIWYTYVNPDRILGNADDRSVRDEVRDFMAGIDFRYFKQLGPEQWHAATVEIWGKKNQYRMTSGPFDTRAGLGAWGMYELGFDQDWSGGYLLSYWETSHYDIEDEGSYNGIFLNRNIGPEHRIRVFFNHTNPGFARQKYYIGGIQYTFRFGAPRRSALLW